MILETSKAVFTHGQSLEIQLETSPRACRWRAALYHLDQEIMTSEGPVHSGRSTVIFPSQNESFHGLWARVIAFDSNALAVDEGGIAISSATQVLRYGFLSDFKACDEGTEDLDWMKQVHINAVQFYDWSLSHDDLVNQGDEYTDMMGKALNLPVIKGKIENCKARGMKAMAYAPVYASRRDFWVNHKDWGLYDSQGKPLVFIGVFYYMNLETPWSEHLCKEYRKVRRLGFSGLHLDTYGWPKKALDASSAPVCLEDQFGPFIDQVKTAIPEMDLIFNNVGSWPMEMTMNHSVSVVYAELWPPMSRYEHIRLVIQRAKASGKSIVIAAYPHFLMECSEEEGLWGALMLDFVICSNGASHLWLGEEGCAVTQGYYSDYYKLTIRQKNAIKAYQDFYVRYEDVLYDPSLQDVSLTHFQGDNREIACSVNANADYQPHKLSLGIRESRKRILLSLLNMESASSDLWNESKASPNPIKDIQFTLEVLQAPSRVWWASADDGGEPQILDWKLDGQALSLVVPALLLSAIVVVEL